MHFISITHPGHNKYLTREEAVQLRSTLAPQSPLFHELQICLLQDSGICTLSNGLKINRIASETRLLGGIGGLQEAQACVGTILNDVVLLKVGQNVLPVCQRISRSIQTLIEFQVVEVQQLGTRIAALKTEMTSAESELSSLKARRDSAQLQENNLQASVANTQAQLNTLAEQISQTNRDVHHAQKKEKKAKKKRGIWTVVATVALGPAGGALAHAATSSSVDHAHDRLRRREQERSLLQAQLTTHSTNLAAKRAEKERFVEQIQKTQQAMTARQNNIQELAATLTDAQNLHSSLTTLSAQYRFLKRDVDLAIEYPDLGLLTGDEANGLEENIKRIQVVYARLWYVQGNRVELKAVKDGNNSSPETNASLWNAHVTRCYQTHLGRLPEPEGLAWWITECSKVGLEAVENGIKNSPEAKARLWNAHVTRCYQTYLGRLPEPEGLAGWVAQCSKVGLEAVENGIKNSPEANERRVN